MPQHVSVRRVVITGLGVISCVGTGNDKFFNGLLGEAPVGYRYVTDFDPLEYFDAKEARQTDRFAQFSLASSKLASRHCRSRSPRSPNEGHVAYRRVSFP